MTITDRTEFIEKCKQNAFYKKLKARVEREDWEQWANGFESTVETRKGEVQNEHGQQSA